MMRRTSDRTAKAGEIARELADSAKSAGFSRAEAHSWATMIVHWAMILYDTETGTASAGEEASRG